MNANKLQTHSTAHSSTERIATRQHGDPCTTPGQANPQTSAYTISGAIIPKGSVNGVPTQLLIAGDPNSLTVNALGNAFMMADTGVGSPPPLFLVKVDLTSPVPGSSPIPRSGLYGCTNTPWIPTSKAWRLP